MNLIYQYWNGALPNCSKSSLENISKYAKRIGAEHRFDHNENWAKNTFGDSSIASYYDAFRPIYDPSFEEYDDVVYMDMDIFAMDNLSDNIFEQDVKDIGICEEVSQPYLRSTTTVAGSINAATDERWASACKKFTPTVELPRDSKGRLRVFNSGVVYFTASGRLNCRKHFKPFGDYISAMEGMPRFYKLDQNYICSAMFDGKIEPTIMSNRWNAQIHYHPTTREVMDERLGKGEQGCLIHMQLSGSNDYPDQQLYNIVNMPPSLWDLP